LEKPKKYLVLASITLTLLLISSATLVTISAAPALSDPALTQMASYTDFRDYAAYGDLMQYEWPHGGANAWTDRYSDGPGPVSPDVLWRFDPGAHGLGGASSEWSSWKGYLYGKCGDQVVKLNALTGELVWASPSSNYPYYIFMPSVQIVDDNYVLTYHYYGFNIYRISDGSLAAETEGEFLIHGVGSSRYWPYRYDMETKRLYADTNTEDGNRQQVTCWDLTNPENPTVVWRANRIRASEMLAVADGIVFMGSNEWGAYALDADDGSLLWNIPLEHPLGFSGAYDHERGVLYAGAVGGAMYAIQGDTGEVLWVDYYGYAGFAAQGNAIGHDKTYIQFFNLDGLHYVAWDLDTGERVWDQLLGREEVSIPYINPAVSDNGIVYIQTRERIERPDGSLTNEDRTTAFWHENGDILFQMNRNFGTPSLAYGNLYGGSGGDVWCVGPPKDWTMFRNNPENPGFAFGTAAPQNLEYKWVHETDAPVTSSAAVSQGRVFIGSHDGNMYALDAYTGAELWRVDTGDRVLASPAVYGVLPPAHAGIVITGTESGTIWGLDAESGTPIWSTSIPVSNDVRDLAFGPAAFSIRSSPIIYQNKVYVGSMNGRVYCINPDNGQIVWEYQTDGPVGASAACLNGRVYIPSTDMYLYCLDYESGNLIWKTRTYSDDLDFPRTQRLPGNPTWARSVGLDIFLVGSPAIAEDLGIVYVGVNRDYRNQGSSPAWQAFSLNDGSSVWNATVGGGNFRGGSPAYGNDGVFYESSGQRIYARNATSGEEIWNYWMTFQGFASMIVADDVDGIRLYQGNGFYTVHVLNDEGERTSFLTLGSQIISTPALWESKLYVGCADYNVYCFTGRAAGF
jgi:outer membrane protein assembly factor BamB